MAGCKPPAQLIVEETGEQARLLRMGAIVPPHAILAETLLDSVPPILVYDGFVHSLKKRHIGSQEAIEC